jgi:hypothetical protein
VSKKSRRRVSRTAASTKDDAPIALSQVGVENKSFLHEHAAGRSWMSRRKDVQLGREARQGVRRAREEGKTLNCFAHR